MKPLECITAELFRPYWLGMARVEGAENLWAGLGGRKSIRVAGNTIEFLFPWARDMSGELPKRLTGTTTRRFTILSVSREGQRGLRLHCGDCIVYLETRRR